jgi:hypothetical protein
MENRIEQRQGNDTAVQGSSMVDGFTSVESLFECVSNFSEKMHRLEHALEEKLISHKI